MNKETKAYEIVGTVTIGSDEYRDLIEAVKDKEMEVKECQADTWKYFEKADRLEKELREIKAKYNSLEEFVKSDAEVYGMYMVWLAEKERGEKE